MEDGGRGAGETFGCRWAAMWVWAVMPKQRATLLKYLVQRAPYVQERGPYTRVRCARALACAKGWQCQCARGKPAAPAPSGLREDGCKFAPSRHAALGGCSKLSTVTLRRISLWQADTASVIIYRACNSIYILPVRHWRQMTVAMPPLPISRGRSGTVAVPQCS